MTVANWLSRLPACAGALARRVVARMTRRGDSAGNAAHRVPPELPAVLPPGTIGYVDLPEAEGIIGTHAKISGWALDPAGIRGVEVRLGEQRRQARIRLPRHDVAQVIPGYPDGDQGGFEFEGDFEPAPWAHDAPQVDRRKLTIVAVAVDGRERVLGYRSLIDPRALARWGDMTMRTGPPFWLLPALSGTQRGDAHGLDTRYVPYASATIAIGMRVPILYLRTTLGPGHDYAFDPDFDVGRRHDGRVIVDDALSHVLADALARRLPVLVTLNGGIWADAACSAPEWDLNDRLEEIIGNCQWNERNAVMADDHLKHLPGSHDAPELARALTLNVYAHDVRRYKKRNLQQAARHLVAFMHAHPALFVGVNLDPDVYINPFFAEEQWYDYNPGTLAQFRHWLAGTGPYAGVAEGGVPDLSRYRRARSLSLDDVRECAGHHYAGWDDVDPPRTFSRDPAQPYWEDRWVREWEVFRRHLVKLHYDELAQWLVEAGMPRERIWSSQGLMAPDGDAMPLALTETSPVKNHDSGGVSIEGSKPRDGHLGVIVYGASASNDARMENSRALYATLASIDPNFAIVEFNTADLRHPERPPTYAVAYRGLRDAWNAGARLVSPMAWNGSNGMLVGDPAYVSFTAWRNTPLEDAALDLVLSRAGLPLGSRLWTFGSPSHADDDGWVAGAGAFSRARGALVLAPGAIGDVTLDSPADLQLDSRSVGAIIVGLPESARITGIRVAARDGSDRPWTPLCKATDGALRRVAAGIAITVKHPAIPITVDQLQVAIGFADRAPVVLTRIAVLMAAAP